MNLAPLDEKQLMWHWTLHAPRVFAYILTLEPNRSNAEDILQETAVTVWEKRSEFAPDSDFRAWACQIAYFKTLSYLRRYRRLSVPGEKLLETLSAEIQQVADNLDARLHALTKCLERLSPRERKIIELRYASKASAKEVAGKMNLSLNGAYKAIQRIHEALFQCIQRERVREERT